MDTYEIKKKRRKIVDLSKIAIKKIRELIVFTAFLVVVLWKFDVVLDVLKAIWGILFPFVLGGAIAFVTNVPMSFLEKKIFGRVKKENMTSINQEPSPPNLLNIWIFLHLDVFYLISSIKDFRIDADYEMDVEDIVYEIQRALE